MRPTLAYRQLLLFLLALGVIVPVLVTLWGQAHHPSNPEVNPGHRAGNRGPVQATH